MSEPLETAYLSLALQVAGVLVAIYAIRRLVVPSISFRALAAPTVVALLAVGLVPRVWTAGDAFSDVRASLRVPAGSTPFEKCFVDAGNLHGAFLSRWLRERIPEGDRWAIQPVKGVDRPCFQLNMGPRVLTDASTDPPWVVVLGNRDRELRDRIAAERFLPSAERTIQFFDVTAVLVENR